MGIYDEFQSRIRSSAMCRDDRGLGVFLQRLCDRMGIAALRDDSMAPLLHDPRVPEFLRLFREEAALMVVLLRATQDDKKRRAS